jgi:hypothetical protein
VPGTLSRVREREEAVRKLMEEYIPALLNERARCMGAVSTRSGTLGG